MIEMDIEEIRPFVLAYLCDTKDREQQFSDVMLGVITRIIKGGLLTVSGKEAEHYLPWEYQTKYNEECIKILEILWDLLFLRVISPGVNIKTEGNASLPFFHLTEYGRKVVAVRELQPHDPDGFLAFVKSEIPNLDAEIERYLAESLQAYRRDLLFSSAVTLGAASEKSLLILMDAIYNALTDQATKKKYGKLMETIRIKEKFDETYKILISNRKQMDKKLQENLESELQGVFHLIRETRNDAGHPTGKILRRDEVFMNLRLFFPFCKKVYQLIDWLNNNQLQ